MRIVHSHLIDAPIEDVWALTLDIERWPEISPTMSRIERLDDGPLDVGSTAMVTQPRQRPRVWTITALEPSHRFEWRATFLGATFTAAHVLTPTGAGTTNELSVDITGPLAPVVGTLVRRPIRAAIAQENDGFKAAAEAVSD